MDALGEIFFPVLSRILYIISAFFIIGGFSMILRSAVTLRTSAAEEDTKTKALFNLKAASIAIILSIIAINYLGEYLTGQEIKFS